MTAVERWTGQCLCGAVTVAATVDAASASACHCAICRRWSGAAMWGLNATEVEVSGPVETYRSSGFAERAWCGRCGTQLWFREDGAVHEVMPGLFDAAHDAPLTREVYVDRAFACVRLTGDHARVTQSDYERDSPHV
jgi:hypothetical protein